MRGEISGFERRRRWSDEDKLEIVLSVGVDGAMVTQVAHRNDVTRQHVYSWRHYQEGAVVSRGWRAVLSCRHCLCTRHFHLQKTIRWCDPYAG